VSAKYYKGDKGVWYVLSVFNFVYLI
jgi:hypothetical protein